MVILQFNKLIRNKWIWGAFAVAISAFFAFDFLIPSANNPKGDDRTAGRLGDEKVRADEFTAVAEDIRGFGRNRDWSRKSHEVNRQAWETLAAFKVAEQVGATATARQVRETILNDRSFQENGQFSFALYQQLLRANSVTDEKFESYLKGRLTLSNVAGAVLDGATWVSPMELDQAADDMTDKFTVKVARFTQTAEEAAKVKVDDAKIKAWYDKNVKSLALPERCRIRFVKFDATNPEFQKKIVLTEDALRDHYDATVDRYTVKGTNGTETVKKFEEVRAQVDKDLRLIEAVQCYETNVLRRAYAGKSDKKVSRLDTIAKADGLKVETSDWFAITGEYVDGFMKRPMSILPGAKNFTEAVAELDPASEDLRYGVVSSDRAVWLIEKAEVSAAHTPKFEEAKKIIEPKALKDAKEEAFKAKVEAIAKGGVKAVLATKDVSTNLTFTVMDLNPRSFADAGVIARTAMKLKKGEISEFTSLGGGRAFVVVCEDRAEGDPASWTMLRTQMRGQMSMMQHQQLPVAWQKWNLERVGFTASDMASTAVSEDE